MTGFEGYEGLSKKLETLSKMADIVERDIGPQISNVMRETAVTEIRRQDIYDTGRLMNSIESKGSEFVLRTSETTVECGIQTSVEYAPFQEYGTGPLGDPSVPHTQRMTWAYMGTDGKIHIGRSQRPRPFMRPALYNNREVFKAIIAGKIREVFD